MLCFTVYTFCLGVFLPLFTPSVRGVFFCVCMRVGGKSRGGAGSSSASASSSSGKERRWRGARSGQEVNVRFPENSDPSKRSLYVNRAIGISMEYPKAWIKQEMSSANMPVQFSARRPRTSRLSGGLSPTIIVCVEKAQEGTTLEKCIKSINARLGEGQTRKPEVVELFNHADKGGLAGKLLCHWVVSGGLAAVAHMDSGSTHVCGRVVT